MLVRAFLVACPPLALYGGLVLEQELTAPSGGEEWSSAARHRALAGGALGGASDQFLRGISGCSLFMATALNLVLRRAPARDEASPNIMLKLHTLPSLSIFSAIVALVGAAHTGLWADFLLCLSLTSVLVCLLRANT